MKQFVIAHLFSPVKDQSAVLILTYLLWFKRVQTQDDL